MRVMRVETLQANKNKTVLNLLDDHDQSLFPKGRSSTTLYPALDRVGSFLSFYFSLHYLVLVY